MKKTRKDDNNFWDLLDSPVVQSFAAALWFVPLYILLKLIPSYIPQWIPEPILTHFLLDLPSITTISAADQTNIANFIEWFGVLYGLILALVLVNVWTQFDATERAFDLEADAVYSLYNTCLFLSNKMLKFEVLKTLQVYAQMVKTKPDITEGDEKIIEEKEENCLKVVGAKIGEVINDKNEHDLGMRLLDSLNELLDHRGDRKSFTKQRLPLPVKYLSIIASIAWLIPFFALKFDNPFIGPFFIVTVTWVVVSILLIIEDLDSPIGGTWGIKFIAWEKIEIQIQEEINFLDEAQNPVKNH